MNLPFPKGLRDRITKRATALDMTPIAYVKRCVESELGKARLGTLTAGKDTPSMNGVKNDFGCGVGYRWVSPGEVIISTDEYRHRGEWVLVTISVGCICETSRFLRRKV